MHAWLGHDLAALLHLKASRQAGGEILLRAAASQPIHVQVRQVLRAGQHTDLAQWDELTRDRQAGRVFEGWQEGPLAFPPTFKFRRGTSHYIGALLLCTFFCTAGFGTTLVPFALSARGVFEGWQERPLTSPPTFKSRRGTSHYISTLHVAGQCAVHACQDTFWPGQGLQQAPSLHRVDPRHAACGDQ